MNVQPYGTFRLHQNNDAMLIPSTHISALVNVPDAGPFEALRDPAFFATAYLDCGAVTWPNGADIAPDAMHKEIQRCGTWRVLD